MQTVSLAGTPLNTQWPHVVVYVVPRSSLGISPSWRQHREPGHWGQQPRERMFPRIRARLKDPASMAAVRTIANPAWVPLGDWSHHPFLSLPGDLENTWMGVGGGDLQKGILDFLTMSTVRSPSINWEKKSLALNLSLKMSKLMLVAKSCPTLCNFMDCSLTGSSVHGIL